MNSLVCDVLFLSVFNLFAVCVPVSCGQTRAPLERCSVRFKARSVASPVCLLSSGTWMMNEIDWCLFFERFVPQTLKHTSMANEWTFHRLLSPEKEQPAYYGLPVVLTAWLYRGFKAKALEERMRTERRKCLVIFNSERVHPDGFW